MIRSVHADGGSSASSLLGRMTSPEASAAEADAEAADERLTAHQLRGAAQQQQYTHAAAAAASSSNFAHTAAAAAAAPAVPLTPLSDSPVLQHFHSLAHGSNQEQAAHEKDSTPKRNAKHALKRKQKTTTH